MPIEIVAAPSGKGDKQKGGANPIELMFFIVLNVLVIPFSGFQTYVGYSSDVVGHPALAFVVAAISAVLFAAMNFGIRERRLEGKPHHWQSIFYILPLGLSFFGNFNAFYSQQMQNELYDKEITKYELVLTATHDRAVQELNRSTRLADIKASKDNALASLETQNAGGGGASGWGTECERDWSLLKSILESEDPLGSKITNFNPGVSNKMAAARALANSYYNQLEVNKNNQISPFVSFADQQYSQIDSLIRIARKNRTLNEDGREILDALVKANNHIGARTQSHLPAFQYEMLETSKENQIGTIKHTLRSAFVEKDSSTALFFSLFLSLIIDLSALFYILLFVPYNTVAGNLNRGPRRV